MLGRIQTLLVCTIATFVEELLTGKYILKSTWLLIIINVHIVKRHFIIKEISRHT